MIRKDRLIKLTQKLIQFDSQNPPGSELACAKFIEKDMRSLGIDVKTYTYAKNRPNIVATLKGTWPRKKAAKSAILLTPHFDTVPFGRGWKFAPTSGKVHQGKVYGRGATDDKGNTAICMEVMRSLVEDKVRLNCDVIMAATVDEETGSHLGIIPLLDKGVLRPGTGVIMDSTEYDAVVAQKGLLHSRIQIFGKAAHGAYNWRGKNAIEDAARVIDRLKKYKFKFKKHKFLHPPTMNIGTITGGDKVNMVADYCEFSLDTRYMPSMKSKEVIRQIKTIISSVTKNYKFIIDDLQEPYEIDPKHPCVDIYIKTLREMKCKGGLKGSEGATVITFFQKHKIPAFATGYGSTGTAHTVDEYVTVDNLYRGSKVLQQYLINYNSVL